VSLGFFVHSNARITHRQHYIRAGFCRGVQPSVSFVQLDVRGFNGNFAAMRYRLARVACQIHQHLLNLTRVGFDTSQTWAAHADHLDVVSNQPTQHLIHVANGHVQNQNYGLQQLPTTEGQKLPRERRSKSTCILNLLDLLAVWVR